MPGARPNGGGSHEGGGGRERGGGGGGGGSSREEARQGVEWNHDYSRASNDSAPVDVALVNQLIAKRLAAKIKKHFDVADQAARLAAVTIVLS